MWSSGTLAGDEGAIKAYSIAVDVFGRPQSFDPQSDPIVRVQARRLRTLLEQFYDAGLGRANVQIRLPLGRYVPEFRSVAAPPIEIEADAALASVAISAVAGHAPAAVAVLGQCAAVTDVHAGRGRAGGGDCAMDVARNAGRDGHAGLSGGDGRQLR